MLIDGEKWACEACVRGHRVSNCQHYDRPLQHINKKGRPVTQCQHCRSQRKNRSAHIKCDCGEKTTKCVHLGALEGHRESCCCNHGGRCTCSFKKDLDTVPETAGSEGEDVDVEKASAKSPSTSATTSSGGSCCGSKNPIRRRRANTTRSEGTLTFDEHGRHKPVSHKHAKAASQKSNPYGFNRISSVRSTGGLSGFLQAANKSACKVEEELDEDDLSSGNAASDSGAEDDDAHASGATATTPAVAVPTPTGTSVLPAQLSSSQRRTRSETASPQLFAGSFPQPHQLTATSSLSPLNMSAISFSAYNFSTFNNTPEQADQPLFSAGLSAPSVDWSQFGLDFDRGFGGASDIEKFGSNDNFGGFPSTFGNEFNGSEQAPTMTTATSGDVSEAEDFMGPGLDDFDYDFDNNGTDAANSSVAAFSRTSSTFNLPTSSVNMQSSNDYQEMRFLKASNKFLPTPQTSAADELTALAATTSLPSAGILDDDENTLWMPDYHGLPSMTESPESDAISFWGAK